MRVAVDDIVWGRGGQSSLFGTEPTRRLPVIYFNDIQPQLDAADFVENLLIRQSMSVIYGQSNSGKTFWALDLALHVAAGMRWNAAPGDPESGREVERMGVLWLAMEGSHGISNRVTAWREFHGIDVAELPFAVIPVVLNLLDPDADTDPLLEAIKATYARMQIPVGWIVVDTLSRAIAGGNENAPDDMGALVTNGSRIQQDGSTAVTWIHHSGKDEAKGARGHSLLRAATDTEIEITADGPQRLARVTKQRELDCAGEFPFTLKVVELGVNKRGKPVTSCVVAGHNEGHTEDPRGFQNRGAPEVLSLRLKGHVRRALDVLHDLLVESGKGGFPGVPAGCLSIPEDWWRQRFYDRTASDGSASAQDSKRKAFNRACAELVERRLVGINRDRVWSVRPGQTGHAEQKPGHPEGDDPQA